MAIAIWFPAEAELTGKLSYDFFPEAYCGKRLLLMSLYPSVEIQQIVMQTIFLTSMHSDEMRSYISWSSCIPSKPSR